MSREYMLTYFLGTGAYFYWGMGAWIYWGGGGVEIFGEMNTPIPPEFAPLVVKSLTISQIV